MLKSKFFLWSLTVALSGLLFGLDTAVISGAEQKIQKLWNLSNSMHGLAIAIALYGTVIGAIFAGIIADKIGRKKILIIIGLLYFISSLGSALTNDIYFFMLYRTIGGLCIGITSVVSPLYISEIAPAKNRGFLVALFQFNIVFGILLAYLSNYIFQSIISDETGWRWMLGIVAVPSLVFTFLTFLISESPRWLILVKNNLDAAKKTLDKIDPINGANTFDSIVKSKQINSANTKVSFFSKAYALPILLVFLLAFFNQLSGINAIIYYAPRIFEMSGLGTSTALLSTAGIGLINLIFTIIGVSWIDKYGRKTLMYIGSIGYIVSLGFISYAFYSKNFNGITIFIFSFIASHAIGQGAVIWVFISEIFPNQVRAYGQSFGCFIHWVFAAIITNVFPIFTSTFGGGIIFLFFSIMMVLQFIFVTFMMPETKGTSLESK